MTGGQSHSFDCWHTRTKLGEWEFKCKHRLAELPKESLEWYEGLKEDAENAAQRCEGCRNQRRPTMATATAVKVSGAQAFRNSVEEKKLSGAEAIKYIAKVTGKEFGEAKYKWYSDLYKAGKLGGVPAEALRKKLGAKKAK